MSERNLPRRPVAGSRTPSTAPRRVAGRALRTPADGVDAEATVTDIESPTTAATEATTTSPKPRGPGWARTGEAEKKTAPRRPRRTTATSSKKPRPERPGLLSGARTTKVLSALVVVLLVVGLAEVGVWAVARFSGDTDASVQKVLALDEPYTVSKTPVEVPLADWRDANDAATKAVTEILNVSWKDYDQNLAEAGTYITDRFAKEYASTTKDTRDLFLKNKAEYDFAVVGASVVEATPDEVASLLFLNQFVYKGEGKQRTGPEIYPVRVTVRMVRTDSGWKIDELRAL